MAWQQLRTPNLAITYTGGWCLKAVEDAFGTPHLYPSASDSWNANEHNHAGEAPPSGVSVPVYFSLGDVPAGHIAISLPDGRVASSTQEGEHVGLYIHPNLADLIRIYAEYHQSCTYLGWSEAVGNTPVVQAVQGGGADMDPHQIAKDLYQAFTGQIPGDDIINQKADYIAANNSVQQVAKDVAQAGGWLSGYDWNHQALADYDAARGGNNPDQFATDRLQGGQKFADVVKIDLPNYIESARQAEQQVVADQNEITELKDQLAKAQQAPAPAPAQPEAPAEPQPAPQPAPTAPVAPAEPPVAPVQPQQDPKPVATHSGPFGWFWALVSALFLGGK